MFLPLHMHGTLFFSLHLLSDSFLDDVCNARAECNPTWVTLGDTLADFTDP